MLAHAHPRRGILAIAFFFLLSAAAPAAAHISVPAPVSQVQKEDNVRVAKRRRRVKRKNRSKPAAPRTDAPPTEDPAATAPPPAAKSAAPDGVDAQGEGGLPGRRRGPSRIDFDERMIKGQTNKANAIYLFERRSSGMRTLVQKRSHFHEEIDDTLR